LIHEEGPGIKRRGNSDIVANAIEAVFKDAQRPLERCDLVRELELRGVVLPSNDKGKYIGTILWRHGNRFESTDEGYWLRGVRRPRVGEFSLPPK
jgi:hypothetical protein